MKNNKIGRPKGRTKINVSLSIKKDLWEIFGKISKQNSRSKSGQFEHMVKQIVEDCEEENAQ